MLLENKEVKEVLKEKVVYKIIVELKRNNFVVYHFALSLKGTKYPARNTTDGIINHRPTEEEVNNAINLAIEKEYLEENFKEKGYEVKVRKITARKVKTIVTKVEENITYENEYEDE